MYQTVGGIGWQCSACETACEHVGAGFSLILEEKTALGLAEPPLESPPAEIVGEEELVERALADRAAKAREERMRVRSAQPGGSSGSRSWDSR